MIKKHSPGETGKQARLAIEGVCDSYLEGGLLEEGPKCLLGARDGGVLSSDGIFDGGLTNQEAVLSIRRQLKRSLASAKHASPCFQLGFGFVSP